MRLFGRRFIIVAIVAVVVGAIILVIAAVVRRCWSDGSCCYRTGRCDCGEDNGDGGCGPSCRILRRRSDQLACRALGRIVCANNIYDRPQSGLLGGIGRDGPQSGPLSGTRRDRLWSGHPRRARRYRTRGDRALAHRGTIGGAPYLLSIAYKKRGRALLVAQVRPVE